MVYFYYASLERNWAVTAVVLNWAVTAVVLNSDICIGRAAFWRNFEKVWRVAMEQCFTVNPERA
jgi:hypothetical protein